MSVEAAQKLVAQALGLGSVGALDGIGTLAEWDSLGHMHIVLALETQLGARLSPEDIVSIASVADVARKLGG